MGRQHAYFLIHQPEAISFYENPEYPGNDMLRLNNRNGEHQISIDIEAVTEIDREIRSGRRAIRIPLLKLYKIHRYPPMRV